MEVRVSTSTTLTDSLRGPFDLAVRRGPQPWDQYEAVRFLDETNTVVASPTLLARQPLRDLRDLAAHTILNSETRPGDWEDWLEAAGYTGQPLTRQHRYDHFFVVLQAALDGFGLAIGPMPVLAQDVALGRLQLPLPEIRVPRRSYYVLRPLDSDPSPIRRSFIEWLRRSGSSL